jgi:hypothetical protein
MNEVRIFLVVAIWLVCGTVIGAGLWIVWLWRSHPLAEPNIFNGPFYLVFLNLPYLILAFSASGLRNRPVVLFLLLVVSILCGFLATSMLYSSQQDSMRFLDAKMEGRKLMSCGPPPILFLSWFGIIILYPLSLLFGLLALNNDLSRDEDSLGSPQVNDDFPPDPAPEVRIQPTEPGFRRPAGGAQDNGQFMTD